MTLHQLPRDEGEAGFLKSQRGSAIIEFVIVFPLLIWAFLGIFLFWDAFRAINLAQKSTFTIADNLSRSSTAVTTGYIDGLADLLAYLSEVQPATGEGVRLRVSSIAWDSANNRHRVSWSYSADNALPALNNTTLLALAPRIPTLTAFETVLLIETQVDYVPAFSGGQVGPFTLCVGARTLQEFVVIRPRFIPRVCLQSTACS
jgi:Flp pilus assembly protein TadG